MTSRTTKQAARAYQKAHGVPYAEALRIVMDGDSQLDPPALGEWEDHARVTGRAAGGKYVPDQGGGTQIVWDPLFDRATPRELLDQYPDLNEQTMLVYRNDTAQVDERDFYEGSDNPPTMPVVAELGQGSAGSPNDPFLTDEITLGHVPLPASALLAGAPPVPVIWNLRRAAGNRTPSLGVHGECGVGKSFYLASLVRANLVGVPTMVVTAHPSNYPEQDGLTYYVQELGDDGAPAPVDPEKVLAASVERKAQAIVYDPSPGSPTEAVDALRVLATRADALLLFASYEEEMGGSAGSGDAVVPDVAVSPSTGERGVFQAASGGESPVQMAPTVDWGLMESRNAAESPRRAT